VRHSAIRAKVRHIPAATDAEMHPTGRQLLQPEKARRERDELLAKIDEAVPHMMDTRRTALGGASPKQRQIGSGATSAASSARTGAPVAGASTAPQGPQPHRTSKAPPGFDAAAGTEPRKGKRRFFGR
jgi:hypothetical protein